MVKDIYPEQSPHLACGGQYNYYNIHHAWALSPQADCLVNAGSIICALHIRSTSSATSSLALGPVFYGRYMTGRTLDLKLMRQDWH